MSEEQVAARLVADIETHLAWFHFSALTIGCILMLTAVFLSARAYAALSEARLLYYRGRVHETDGAHGGGARRQSTPANINAAANRRKIPTRRGRTLP